MEVKQKIETRILRAEDGSRLTLEYCLLARLQLHPQKALCAPFGMEVTLRTPQGARTEVCRNLSESHRSALALIHLFAAHCVAPAAAPAAKPARRLSGRKKAPIFHPAGKIAPQRAFLLQFRSLFRKSQVFFRQLSKVFVDKSIDSCYNVCTFCALWHQLFCKRERSRIL